MGTFVERKEETGLSTFSDLVKRQRVREGPGKRLGGRVLEKSRAEDVHWLST